MSGSKGGVATSPEGVFQDHQIIDKIRAGWTGAVQQYLDENLNYSPIRLCSIWPYTASVLASSYLERFEQWPYQHPTDLHPLIQTSKEPGV